MFPIAVKPAKADARMRAMGNGKGKGGYFARAMASQRTEIWEQKIGVRTFMTRVGGLQP